MKKLLIFCGFILSCGYVSAQQYGATYTPYSRPVDNYNYQQPILGNQRQARVQSGTRREMTVQVVKNCIALFPDNSHMTVDVHVKKISDSARSFGFVVSGTLFALPNANGLVKIGYMREMILILLQTILLRNLRNKGGLYPVCSPLVKYCNG